MNRVVFYLWLLAPALAACSFVPNAGPTRDQVIADAHGAGHPRFDVVKIDNRVIATLLARPQPPFRERFKKYSPPPELPIAVGDVLSVMIWESAADGLFGRSLAANTASGRQLADELRAAGVTLPEGPISATELTDILARLKETAIGQSVLQSLQPTGRSGTRIPNQQVGPDGAISVPYAGRIQVAGLTPSAVQQRIAHRLAQKALDPQVLVVVESSDANSVSVTGGLIEGARIRLAPGGSRLLDVIAAAGGARAPVHDTYVKLSRDGVTAAIPLAILVADPDEDIFARPGDVLTLVRRPQVISVFGATGKNKAIVFDRDRVSLSEALGKSGGLLDNRADPRAVFLLRYEPTAIVRALGEPIVPGTPAGVSPVAYQLDLDNVKSYALADRFRVRDRDIIYVSNAKVTALQKVLNLFQNITAPAISGYLTCTTIKC